MRGSDGLKITRITAAVGSKVSRRATTVGFNCRFWDYGITGNGRGLNQVYEATNKLWHKWLNRRSDAPGGMTWKRFQQVSQQWLVLPQPHIVHSIYKAKP